VFRITCQFLSQSHFEDPELPIAHHLRFAFHDTHVDAAAGGAHCTNARLPDGYTGQKIFFRYEANQLRSSIAAPFQRQCRTAQDCEIQKRSAFHGLKTPLNTQ
jgi:hypothetical protein